MNQTQRRFGLAALALLGAFALDCGLTDPEVGSAQFAYKSQQGERLQATAPALGSGALWVQATGAIGPAGTPFDQVFVERAELRALRNGHLNTGSALVGTRLLAKSDPALAAPDLELFVRDLVPHGPAGEFEYRVDYHSLTNPGQPVAALCQDAGARALPVTGTWHSSGGYLPPVNGSFSFACRGGVVVKCLDWGYKPWANFAGPPSTPLRPFHQVCTRMARADYCTNGSSYTLDKTPIDLFDRLPLNTESPPDPDEPPYYLESIWGPDGGFVGGPPALRCLGKRRWDTLPLGGACPLKVPDPRVDRRARFCEDRTWAQWKADGAILANSSLYIDHGLFRWKRVAGEGSYTTTQYIYRGAQPSPTGPPPGYSFSAFEGAVYRDDLGAAGLLPPGTLVPLFSFFSASRGDYLTTSAADPNTMPHPPWDGLPLDYGQKTTVGFLYAPPPTLPWPAPHPRAKLLFSFYSPSRRLHVTSRVKPSPAMNDDFVLVRIEGYVLLKQ